MNKIYLAAITGAALMAVAGIANAQGTGTSSGSSGTSSNQCWDVSSNMVRDKNQTGASGTSSGNTSSAVGSTSSDSTSSKRAMGTGAVGAGGTGSSNSARPAGIPDC